MKTDNEFEGIGKKTTYKVPEGFFEQVPEKNTPESKTIGTKTKDEIGALANSSSSCVTVGNSFPWLLYVRTWEAGNIPDCSG